MERGIVLIPYCSFLFDLYVNATLLIINSLGSIIVAIYLKSFLS